MKKFYYIERVQQWINIFKIVTIFREGLQWHVTLEGGEAVILNDGEYSELVPLLNEPPHKPEEKKPEEGQE